MNKKDLKTKKFNLRSLLSVTTGRLLTEPKKSGDNGIGDLYNIIGWIKGRDQSTLDLIATADECESWLIRWFPEIAVASACLSSLDRWLKSDRTDGQEGIKMWLTELKMMFPDIKDEYDVPQIP